GVAARLADGAEAIAERSRGDSAQPELRPAYVEDGERHRLHPGVELAHRAAEQAGDLGVAAGEGEGGRREPPPVAFAGEEGGLREDDRPPVDNASAGEAQAPRRDVRDRVEQEVAAARAGDAG